MWGSLVVFSAVLAVVFSTTNVQQCTSNPGALPISTSVQGCTQPPCQLPQLQDAVLDIVFQAPRDIVSMTTLATAYLRVGLITIPVPYDLEEKAVTCDYLADAQCPLSAGQVVQYTLRMYIEPLFPVGVAPTIEFRAVDQSNSPVFCLRVPVVIVNPVTKSIA